MMLYPELPCMYTATLCSESWTVLVTGKDQYRLDGMWDWLMMNKAEAAEKTFNVIYSKRYLFYHNVQTPTPSLQDAMSLINTYNLNILHVKNGLIFLIDLTTKKICSVSVAFKMFFVLSRSMYVNNTCLKWSIVATFILVVSCCVCDVIAFRCICHHCQRLTGRKSIWTFALDNCCDFSHTCLRTNPGCQVSRTVALAAR